MSIYKNNFQATTDNFLAFFIAITSPIEVSVEESFLILNGTIEYPHERDISPELLYEIVQRVSENTLSYSRMERKYHVNRMKIKKIAGFIREMRTEERSSRENAYYKKRCV